MSIGTLFKRIVNWLDDADVHILKKYWVLSVSLHLLLFLYITIMDVKGVMAGFNGRCFTCNHSAYGTSDVYLLPVSLLICPFTGIFAYFADFIDEAHNILDAPLSRYVLFPFLGVPLYICYPLVLYARKNKYIKHLVYIIPAFLSLLGTLSSIIEASRGSA